MRFGEDGFQRRVVHRDDLGRVLDSNREAGGIMRGEFGLEDVLEADQHDFEAEIARGEDGAFDRSLRREVAPHRVERDSQLLLSRANYSVVAESWRPR